MKKASFALSIVCLLLTLLPSFFVYLQMISLETNKNLMLIGTIGWFLTAPFWMNKNKENYAPDTHHST
jgi:hypothetical protein